MVFSRNRLEEIEDAALAPYGIKSRTSARAPVSRR